MDKTLTKIEIFNISTQKSSIPNFPLLVFKGYVQTQQYADVMR